MEAHVDYSLASIEFDRVLGARGTTEDNNTTAVHFTSRTRQHEQLLEDRCLVYSEVGPVSLALLFVF